MAHAVSLERFPQSKIYLERGHWEKILAAGGLIIIALIQMSVAGSFYLLRRHLWYDEILTHTLVTDPDFGHALRGLASGVETHPPTLYALLRLFTWATGGATEVTLRLFPLLCIGIAFWGIYLVLRRSFSPWPAFGAVLALWCHPLVVVQAFEARSYAPWLAGISWFTYFLCRSRTAPVGLVSSILLASLAAFVCVIHYFGVISVGLVTAFEILARRRAGVPLRSGLESVAVGPLTLLACLPLLLRQRAAMSVPTWVEPAGLGWSFQFLSNLLFPSSLAAVVVMVWLAEVLPMTRQETAAPHGRAPSILSEVALTSLVFLPIVMVAFSFAVQSVLHEKYAFPAVAGLAPAVAFLLSRMSVPWQAVLCVALALTGIREHHQYARNCRDYDEQFMANLIDTLRQETGSEDLIFDNLHYLYVVCRYAPDLAQRCFYLDFEPGQIGNAPNDRIFARDLARHYEAFYSIPRLKKWDAVRSEGHFFLVPTYLAGLNSRQAGGPYPGFTVRIYEGGVYKAVAQRD